MNTDIRKVLQQIDGAARRTAAGVVEKLPSPGDPNAKPGKDCGCARRKKLLAESLRRGTSAGSIVRDILKDVQEK